MSTIELDGRGHIIDDDLPSEADIAALKYRGEAEGLLAHLNARMERVSQQLADEAFVAERGEDWVRRARGYQRAVTRRRQAVRKILGTLPIEAHERKRLSKLGVVYSPRNKEIPLTTFDEMRMATNRQKRILNLCERLYRAYGAAMDSDDDDAWVACDEAYEAIKAMLLPDEPEQALDE